MKEQSVFLFSQAVYGDGGEFLGFVGYTREKRYVACVPDADGGLRSVELVQDEAALTMVVPPKSRDRAPPPNLSEEEVKRWRRFDRHHTFAGVNFGRAVTWLRELVGAWERWSRSADRIRPGAPQEEVVGILLARLLLLTEQVDRLPSNE